MNLPRFRIVLDNGSGPIDTIDVARQEDIMPAIAARKWKLFGGDTIRITDRLEEED